MTRRVAGLEIPATWLLVAVTMGPVACSATAAYLERGEQLEQAQMYEEALEEYRQAQKVDPQDQQLQERISRLERLLADQACAEGQSLLQMKDYLGALDAFLRARQLVPEHEPARTEMSRVLTKLLARLDGLLDKGKLEEAGKLVEQLHERLPRDAQIGAARGRVRLELAKQLKRQAEQDMEKNLFGRALVGLCRLEQLVQVWGNSAELKALARQRLEESARFGVRLKVEAASRKLRGPAAALARLLERISIPDCPTLRLVTGRGEAKLTMRLVVESLDYDEERSESSGEHKYQSGTRPVDNPQFQKLQEQLESKQARLSELEQQLKEDAQVVEQCRRAFADAGPDDDEESLRNRLVEAEKLQQKHLREQKQLQEESVALRRQRARTPRLVDEPVYDVYHFPVYQVTRRLRLGLRLRAWGEGRQRLHEELYHATAETSDKTNRAYRRYGVKADPLRFPRDDAQLVELALKQGAKHTRQILGRLCRSWQGEILERARAAASDAPLEAAEDYILYLFAAPGKAPSDLTNFLKEYFQLDDLRILHPQAGTAKPAPGEPENPSELEPGSGLEI